jgi:ABC-type transporter Mla MlaB component
LISDAGLPGSVAVNIETISTERPIRLRLNGDLTFGTIRDVHQAVCAAASGKSEETVIVDLQGVEAIDLSALQWMIACRSRVTFEGDDALSRLARMARFAGLDLEEALRHHE